MIYVCEYDGSADDDGLWERAHLDSLPLAFSEKRTEGSRWQKQRERILAWLLLEKALGKEFGISVAELKVERQKWGKPYSSAHPGIYFNLSHCRNACACMAGREDAGIDVEQIFPYRKPLEKKICHAQELQILEMLPQMERERQLRYLWSMKESFVKLDGRGLGYGMDRVNLAQALPLLSKRGQGIDRVSIEMYPDAQETKGKPDSRELQFLVYGTAAYTLAACGENLQTQVCYVQEGELLK